MTDPQNLIYQVERLVENARTYKQIKQRETNIPPPRAEGPPKLTVVKN